MTVADDVRKIVGPDVPAWTRAASTAFTQLNNGGFAPSTLALLNYNALSSKATLDGSVANACNKPKAPHTCAGVATKTLFQTSKGPERQVVMRDGDVQLLSLTGSIAPGPKSWKQPYPQPLPKPKPKPQPTMPPCYYCAAPSQYYPQPQPQYYYVAPPVTHMMQPQPQPQQPQPPQQQQQWYHSGMIPPAHMPREYHHVHHHATYERPRIPGAVSVFDERERLYSHS